EDAAVVINVIDLGVTLGAADAVLFSVLRGLNVNAVGRAGGGAQEAGNTLFQAVLIALQHVQAAETLLEHRAFHRSRPVRIVFNHGGSKHLPESDRHSFGNAGEIAKDRHASSIKGNHGGDKGTRRDEQAWCAVHSKPSFAYHANMAKAALSKKQHEEILKALQARFEKNMNRHKGVEWAKVQAKPEANAEKLWSLNEMEK